jgi:Tfp pilus assembly PilM family ATPase
MSGVELTNAIVKACAVDFRQAEEQKRRDGLLANPNEVTAQKALTAVLERGLRELHKVMARYEEEEGVSVSKIVLTGSGALLYGLPAYIGEMLARPVVIADPFAKVAYPAFLEDTLKEAGPAFAVAVGTALRGLASE